MLHLIVDYKGMCNDLNLLQDIKKVSDADQSAESQGFLLDSEIYLNRMAPAVSWCDMRWQMEEEKASQLHF